MREGTSDRKGEREKPAHIEKTSSPLESNFNRFLPPFLSPFLSLSRSPLPLLSRSLLLSFVFRLPSPSLPLSGVKASRPAAALRGSPTALRHRLREGGLTKSRNSQVRFSQPSMRLRPGSARGWPAAAPHQNRGMAIRCLCVCMSVCIDGIS